MLGYVGASRCGGFSSGIHPVSDISSILGNTSARGFLEGEAGQLSYIHLAYLFRPLVCIVLARRPVPGSRPAEALSPHSVSAQSGTTARGSGAGVILSGVTGYCWVVLVRVLQVSEFPTSVG